ncbi:MAG: thioredoxin, partial [Betaproteobacteria bacterium]|nr:thioredoxin [Betaproteobacteria bacterium]
MIELKSRRLTADDEGSAIELCYANGWTDGLPVIPPTASRIAAMLEAGGLEPGKQLSFIENRQVSVTAEKVAINAVMAGCKPEFMPVITATVEALADPLYGYHGPATSTGGSAVFMLVNGPIAKQLNINSGDNVFGQGWRANATIGRAIRLVMQNVIGTTPGVLDRSSLGHPGKYTFCIAENEVDSPWPPFHTTRGFKPEHNAVTIFAALGVHQYSNGLSATPEGVLTTACAQ